MGVLFGVLLVAIAVVVYIYVCGLVLVYVTAPAVLIGATVGVLAGFVVAMVQAAMVLTGRVGGLRTPADVADGRVLRRTKPHQLRLDLAWPQYFTAQVRLDLLAARGLARAALGPVWRRPIRWVARIDYRVSLAAWPLLVPVFATVLAISLGVVAGLLVFAGVVGLVTALAWLLGLPLVATLRGVDRVWQAVFRAGGTCPRCYEVSRLPAYRCAGPHSQRERREALDLHRDIRPGRLGVLWRRCGCDRRLPTMVLRASRAMTACCPLCTETLHAGAAVDTDVRIPVFGAASAGKTHLIMAALVALQRDSRRDVVAADDGSARRLRHYTEVVDGGGSAPKTDAAQQPVAVTLRMRTGRRHATVHVFDAAGEALADPDENARLAYLDYARTLIFVLDPFSVPEIRDSYAKTYEDVFRRANPATEHPESSYNATVTRMRGYGVNTSRRRLAFVVSKEDLLAELPTVGAPGPDSARVREWLNDRRLDNLVTAAQRDFGQVRYFLVSAKRSSGSTSPIAVFEWLLAGEHIPVPRTTEQMVSEPA